MKEHTPNMKFFSLDARFLVALGGFKSIRGAGREEFAELSRKRVKGFPPGGLHHRIAKDFLIDRGSDLVPFVETSDSQPTL